MGMCTPGSGALLQALPATFTYERREALVFATKEEADAVAMRLHREGWSTYADPAWKHPGLGYPFPQQHPDEIRAWLKANGPPKRPKP